MTPWFADAAQSGLQSPPFNCGNPPTNNGPETLIPDRLPGEHPDLGTVAPMKFMQVPRLRSDRSSGSLWTFALHDSN